MLKPILFTLIVTLSFPSLGRSLKVLIDPGHGGDAPGAIQGPYQEAHYTWLWSQALFKELNKSKDFKPFLTRKKGQSLSLEKRVEVALKTKPDVFLSLHLNSFKDPDVSGMEFYIQKSLSSNDMANFLAQFESHEEIQNSTSTQFDFLKDLKLDLTHELILTGLVKKKLQRKSKLLAETLKKHFPDSRIKYGDFFLLKQLPHVSLFIEVGYMSNPKDLKNITRPQFIKKQVKKILLGLRLYKQSHHF